MSLTLTASGLGYALLHSLWQVALVALGTALALGLAGGRSARFRYGMACAGMSLMLLVPLGTLVRFSQSRASAQTLIWMVPEKQAPVPLASKAPAFTVVPGVGSVAGAHPWLGSLSLWAARLWMLGACLMSLRMGLIWMQERRAFHHDFEKVEEALAERFQVLCQRMGVQRVILRLSRRAGTPMTWGFLRPIVLLPASCLLHLSPEALEAVLLHELAHVRRWDYLVGLLQSLVEVLLFYHPGVWWLSRRLRELREHCCDDLVMQLQGDPLEYAEALVKLERLRTSLPRLVPASQHGNLMKRIERMLQPAEVRPLKLNVLALPLSVALLGGVLVSSRVARAEAVVTPQATFSYSTGSVKALRIEGCDPAWINALAIQWNEPRTAEEKAAHDEHERLKNQAWATLFDWTSAQIQLRLEALKRKQVGAPYSYTAPPNNADGCPYETYLEQNLKHKSQLMAMHVPEPGKPGAITFHLDALTTVQVMDNATERAALEEALQIIKGARKGEDYGCYPNLSTNPVKVELPPVVALPAPKTGTAFLISTGAQAGLRVVGFEPLLPKNAWIAEKPFAEVRAIEQWALQQVRARREALRSGQASPLLNYDELSLKFPGWSRDETILEVGDMDAIGHGKTGSMFSAHPAGNGQRMSVGFRSPALEAFKGRKPTPAEEVQALDALESLLNEYLEGKYSAMFITIPDKDHPGGTIAMGWTKMK